jgi:pimeloyl-ACP methyl ester carboxylesterase
MASELVISGGGAIAVATAELHDLVQRCEAIVQTARWARGAVSRLGGVGWEGETSCSGVHASAANRAIERAGIALAECEFRADVTVGALRFAADAYGFTEATVAGTLRRLAGILGYGIGAMAPLLITLFAAFAVVTLPAALLGASVLRLWAVNDPVAARHFGANLGAWLSEHRAALTTPLAVTVIGNVFSSADELAAGVFGIPPALVALLGEDGLGVTGISSSALLAVLASAPSGALRESPVVAQRTTTRILDRAPVGLADRIDRLPSPGSNANGEQIRIDRYSVVGQPDRFEVFIAGTVDFSAIATDEPFDLTSNIHAIAELPAGSDRAVREAMKHAGINSGSPVVFTGHSQGGMIAANLAASGDFNARGVVTIGAPDGNIIVNADVPVISIAHTDDLVTVLNGPRTDPHTIVVERQAFANREIPEGAILPAHDRLEYRETATRADQATHSELAAAIAAIDGMTQGATPVSHSLYLARRTEPGPL